MPEKEGYLPNERVNLYKNIGRKKRSGSEKSARQKTKTPIAPQSQKGSVLNESPVRIEPKNPETEAKRENPEIRAKKPATLANNSAGLPGPSVYYEKGLREEFPIDRAKLTTFLQGLDLEEDKINSLVIHVNRQHRFSLRRRVFALSRDEVEYDRERNRLNITTGKTSERYQSELEKAEKVITGQKEPDYTDFAGLTPDTQFSKILATANKEQARAYAEQTIRESLQKDLNSKVLEQIHHMTTSDSLRRSVVFFKGTLSSMAVLAVDQHIIYDDPNIYAANALYILVAKTVYEAASLWFDLRNNRARKFAKQKLNIPANQVLTFRPALIS